MQLSAYYKSDFDAMPKLFRQNFFNALTGFKSLNLVGTIDEKGDTNLAVFSQVIHVGADPSLIGILLRPDSVPRHTLHNIQSTGVFTLNHVQKDFVKQAHQSSARYPKEQSEFERCGLTPFYSPHFKAPYVSESIIRIGLKWRETIQVRTNLTVFLIGEVVEVMLPEDIVMDDGYIDLHQAGTITVAGLDAYHETQKLVRLSYAKPDKNLIEIDF